MSTIVEITKIRELLECLTDEMVYFAAEVENIAIQDKSNMCIGFINLKEATLTYYEKVTVKALGRG